MPSSSTSGEPADTHTSRKWEYVLLASALSVIGLAALAFFYSRNEILLSGDAVAHINIARRVFDSRTPGLLQLGSVWLPLPHLLSLPFVVSDRMWQSGIGGSIVSLLSYICAGLGMFRLLLRWSKAGAWVGTAIFAANPNLLYVQSTALNEPLYLAAFIWSTVCFVEAFVRLRQRDDRSAGRWLQFGAMGLTAAVFTRYDGWFLALVCWVSVSGILLKRLRRNPAREFRMGVLKALLLTALGPSLWLAYNFGVYGNPLEFANGPYSAKAIALHTTQPGAPPYPGKDHVVAAATYFVKTAQLNVADGPIAKLLVLLAALGSAAILLRRFSPTVVLLWSPLVFYALSIAYGAVPIFIPVWWPFSYYNTRYGLELLPAIATGTGLCVFWLEMRFKSVRARQVVVFLFLIAGCICYWNTWRQTPICLRETRANGQARMQVDEQLADALKSLPANSTVLTYAGAHSGGFELAAFPFRESVNEGNLYVWDAALALPAMAADYVIASAGDPVSEAVKRHPGYLSELLRIEVPGQPETILYKSELRPPRSRSTQRAALNPRRQ